MGGRALTRRRAGAAVAALWLAAVPVLYFAPAARDGLGQTLASWPPDVALTTVPLQLLGPVGVALAVVLAGWGIGRGPARWLDAGGAGRQDPEGAGAREASSVTGAGAVAAATALGLGALSLGALGLAAVGQYRPLALTLVIAAGAVAAIAGLRGAIRGPGRRRRRLRPAGPFEWSLTGLLAAAGAFALVGALAPEVEYDAAWYHLGLPQRFLAAGSLVDLPCQSVSLYPLGTELLYGYGLALDGPIAAKLLHFAFGVLLVLATYDLARAVGDRRTGLVAAALLASVPTVLWEATTAYIDLATGLFVVLSLRRVLRFAAEGNRRALVAAGIFAGLALMTKHTAAFAVIPLGATILLVPRGRGAARRALDGGLYALLALAPAAPWLVRAEVLAGNPFFPSLYTVFGAAAGRWSPKLEAGLAAFLDRFGTHRGAASLVLLPWDLTMHTAAYGGALGAIFLMLLPFAARRRPGRPLLIVAGVLVVFVALWASPVSSQQFRFLIPVLPALAVLGAVGLARATAAVRPLHRMAAPAVQALALAVLALSLPPFLHMHERDLPSPRGFLTQVLFEVPTGVVSGSEPREEYLARRIETYGAVPALNREAAPAGRAVVFGDPVSVYARPETVLAEGRCAGEAAFAPRGQEAVAFRGLRRAGIRHVVIGRRSDPRTAVTGRAFARFADTVVQRPRVRLLRLRDRPRAQRATGRSPR